MTTKKTLTKKDIIGFVASVLRTEFGMSLARIAGVLGTNRTSLARYINEVQFEGFDLDLTFPKGFYDQFEHNMPKNLPFPGQVIQIYGDTKVVLDVCTQYVELYNKDVGVYKEYDLALFNQPKTTKSKSKRPSRSKKKVVSVGVEETIIKPKSKRKSRAKVKLAQVVNDAPKVGTTLTTSQPCDAPTAFVETKQDARFASIKETDYPNLKFVKSEPKEKPQYLITDHCVVVIRKGKPETIDKSHKNFDKIKAALDTGDAQKAYDLIDLRNAISRWSDGKIVVTKDQVTFDGRKVHPKLTNRMIGLLVDAPDGYEKILASWAKFITKCDSNPSQRVVTRIYDFLQANDIEIDEDGDIIAFKVVRHNFLDKHSGTMDNSVGKVVEMKRNEVNDNDSETCSSGLHVCSKSYIGSFSSGGDKLVKCKVNPADWVSVPTDYNNAKARVCKYTVVSEVKGGITK